jgi:DNA invertase Pin-like site-specific DNA recombinase
MTKQALIVLRRSTGNQDVSLAAQEADCRSLCEQNGWNVKKVYSDTASGAASLDRRPGLVAALSELKKGEVIVARSASRLTRDLSVHLAIESEVERRKADLCFVDGGMNEDDPQQQLLRTIKAAFNVYELAIQSFRIKSALNKLRTDGRVLGNPKRCRYGFQVSEDGRSLEVNAEEMAVVERVYRLKEEQGLSGTRIAEILKLEGYTTRLGKPHHQSGIYVMLKRVKEHPQLYPFMSEVEAA